MTHFIILSHARAGNVFLTRILNQHPRLFCVGEAFNVNPEHEHVFYVRTVMETDTPPGLADLPCLLDACAHHEQRKHVGVTLFSRPGHTLSIAEVAQLIACGYKVLFLRRRNLLKAFCSWYRAQQTNLWHLDEGGRPILWRGVAMPQLPTTNDSFAVDIDQAEHWITETQEFLQAIETELDRRQDRGLRLSYEVLCLGDRAQVEREVGRVFDYLGVERVPFEIKTLRTSSDHFYHQISNRAELEARLGYSLS